jgi:hypothetical protein
MPWLGVGDSAHCAAGDSGTARGIWEYPESASAVTAQLFCIRLTLRKPQPATDSQPR